MANLGQPFVQLPPPAGGPPQPVANNLLQWLADRYHFNAPRHGHVFLRVVLPVSLLLTVFVLVVVGYVLYNSRDKCSSARDDVIWSDAKQQSGQYQVLDSATGDWSQYAGYVPQLFVAWSYPVIISSATVSDDVRWQPTTCSYWSPDQLIPFSYINVTTYELPQRAGWRVTIVTEMEYDPPLSMLMQGQPAADLAPFLQPGSVALSAYPPYGRGNITLLGNTFTNTTAANTVINNFAGGLTAQAPLLILAACTTYITMLHEAIRTQCEPPSWVDVLYLIGSAVGWLGGLHVVMGMVLRFCNP